MHPLRNCVHSCLFGRQWSTFTKCLEVISPVHSRILPEEALIPLQCMFLSWKLANYPIQCVHILKCRLDSQIELLCFPRRISAFIQNDSATKFESTLNLNLKPNEGILLHFGKFASSELNPLNSQFPN
ncbi:Hypothetical_protein [Hexamita inflata]|uniref:Hypothetical_protein n=1 Tax=Hexamita inflata TaxID=28002 RepID=A0AA86NNA4_9EUKA|nr:Hypothetical protein HINF_LOCUS9515 [Hexamita inflata]